MKIKAFKSFGKVIAVASATVLCISMLALTGCGGSSSSSTPSSNASSGNSGKGDVATEELMSGIHHASVTVEGFEPFTIELNADEAPISVTNFVNLAKDGYYDGLTFYRIQDDFCMQGGTKGNTASGNDPSLKPIKGEFSANGIDNQMADDFQRGTVAMARTSQPDSATSTFFVTLSSSYVSSLNGNYAAFGTIDAAGMDIVDSIVEKFAPFADQGDMGIITDASNQPVISSITIVD